MKSNLCVISTYTYMGQPKSEYNCSAISLADRFKCTFYEYGRFNIEKEGIKRKCKYEVVTSPAPIIPTRCTNKQANLMAEMVG